MDRKNSPELQEWETAVTENEIWPLRAGETAEQITHRIIDVNVELITD